MQSGSGYEHRWRTPAGRAWFCLTAAAVTLAGGLAAAMPAYAASAAAAPNSASPSSQLAASSSAPAPAPKPTATQRFDIDDFAVQGADTLPQIEIEEAIYPFLGPNKTADDVEKARAALEKAYHDKGFQTVSVSVPQQNAQAKVISLQGDRVEGRTAAGEELALFRSRQDHGQARLAEGGHGSEFHRRHQGYRRAEPVAGPAGDAGAARRASRQAPSTSI